MNVYQKQTINESQITSSSNDLVIGKGVSFNGTVAVPNRAVINGDFNGELTARELIVEEDGVAVGTITANDVEVKGVLKSIVICKNLLTIHQTGSIEGDMEYGDIVIQRGGKFTGNLKQR